MTKWALAATLAALTACRAPPPKPIEPRALSVDEVAARVGQPGVFLFDANPKEMYEHAHLPTASWVKFDAVTADVLPKDKASTLVFYCANELCLASHDAARSALGLGYANTFVMPQGFFGWKKSGREVVRPPAQGESGTRGLANTQSQ